MALVIGGKYHEDEMDYHIQHQTQDDNIITPPSDSTLDKNELSVKNFMGNKASIPDPKNVYNDAGDIVDFRNQNDDFNAMGKDLGLDNIPSN